LSVAIKAEKPKAIKLAKSASGFSGNNPSPEGGRKLWSNYTPLEEDVNCFVKGSSPFHSQRDVIIIASSPREMYYDKSPEKSLRTKLVDNISQISVQLLKPHRPLWYFCRREAKILLTAKTCTSQWVNVFNQLKKIGWVAGFYRNLTVPGKQHSQIGWPSS
jgi:hypothetical protein